MDTTYTIIPDFMLDFDLSDKELLALAVIYGFSQDGDSEFHGSYNYLARKCRCSRKWAIEIVSSLAEKGLISKRTEDRDGVKVCHYRYIGGSELSTPVVNSTSPGVVNYSSPGGSELRFTPYYNIDNIKRNNKPSISPFDFLGGLTGLGVPEELAREWLAVRKTKRLTNTRTAFDNIAREIAKTGLPATDCIRLAVENSWGGFRADWMTVASPTTVAYKPGNASSW